MTIKKFITLVPNLLQPTVLITIENILSFKHYLQSLGKKPYSAPIYVLGNQKSGTSAIAGLLAKQFGLSLASDLKNTNRKFSLYIKLKNGEISFEEFISNNKFEFSHKLIKESNLTIFYKGLFHHFPKSNFIFIIRDPRDNIRSILDRFNIPGNIQKLNPSHKKSIVYSWKLIFDMHCLGQEEENFIENLSARWNYIADIYLKNRDRMILVRYEDFVKDKIGLIDYLGQALELNQVHKINNIINHNFQPPGKNRNISWNNFFGRENLLKIERKCRDHMENFDYNTSIK